MHRLARGSLVARGALAALGWVALWGLALGCAGWDPRASLGSRSWEPTLERVTRAVVTLRVNAPRAFDDGLPGFSTATGFVVDRERGLILTNRHVVQPGPTVANAVLLNHEEIEIEAVYRDPVHDFGFFRFDPDDVRFMELAELPLSPERARVGTETRVVGNDAGEQLSILAGTLARLDREAPAYGRGRYNDFNTFYLQAASSISGGSSGSPMVDRDGHAIALTAGGNRESASSFFLPLDRVVRALEYVRRGETVPRGTLRAIFVHRSYDELSRLGLAPEVEGEVRAAFPDGQGLLVVDEVVPGGPAEGQLEPGDVLLSIDGRPLNAFVPLEEALDSHVGRPLRLALARGPERFEVELEPEDLHAIEPRAYLEVGGGVLNPLSLTLARHYALPVGGVMVALRGYLLGRAGVPHRALITSLDGRETPDLESFQAVLESLPDGQRVPVRYFELDQSRTEHTALLPIDRRWYPTRRCELRSASARWLCEPLARPRAEAELEVRETRFESHSDPALDRLAPSLVFVSFSIPFLIDGVHDTHFGGAGLVVDAERGLVVVDRETVPIALGDIDLTFARSVRVPGELVYLHPEHNLAVVRYDPARIGATPVRAARLDARPLDVGDDVALVGLTPDQQLISRRTQISAIDPLSIPLPSSPRFRDMNLEVVSVEDVAPTVGGVLSDASGRVRAFWAAFSSDRGRGTASFANGIPIARLQEVLEPLRRGDPVEWRSLGVEWTPVSLSTARDLGLPEAVAGPLEAAGAGRRTVLAVARRRAGSPAEAELRDGDLLVQIEGEAVADFAAVERIAQRPEVALRVLRDGELIDLRVRTQPMSGEGTRRALIWAGALLQMPHEAVALQRGIDPVGVYVPFYFYGSPAHRDGLRATRLIEEVNGQPTPDLDALVEAVASIPDGGAVRLRVRTLEGNVEIVTLRMDLRYWPAWELVRGESGWERRDVPAGADATSERSAGR